MADSAYIYAMANTQNPKNKKIKSKKATKKVAAKKAAKSDAKDKFRSRESSLVQTKTSRPLWKWLKWILTFGIWGGVAFAGILLWFAWDLPNPETATKAITRNPSMTVLAADGSVLARQGGTHGRPITLDELPPSVIQAFIATEDRRFYDHFGIDIFGLGRAIFVNLTSGGYRQGGSSLTQQLAKNLFLTREKTIRRKVQELLLAFWLEKSFSKDEILTIYLNRVYLGSGVYGVDAAARKYFGKSASNLSLYESAVLAGLPKAPSAYNPRANAERSAKRANLVLDLMVNAEFLQQATADTHKRKKVKIVGARAGQNNRYFADWVMGRVSHLIGPIDDDLIIQTTFEPSHQRALESQIWKILNQAVKANAEQIAAVIMREDGAVTAMLGGKNWSISPFNRAVHAKRQTGSVFKPIAYLAGLESGLEPDDQIDISNIVIDGWSPRDQSLLNNPDNGYQEKVSLENGLRLSLNKAAVAIAEKVGRGEVIQMARRLGITAPMQEHPSLPLGVQEISLMEMTGAYAVIANNGLAAIPHGIKEIRAGNGEVLFTHFEDDSEILDEDIAENMTEMLHSVVLDGTGKRAQLEKSYVSGKTGTTQLNKDAWFIGFAKDNLTARKALAMGVWIGNDKATPMDNISGGGYPAIYWQRVMSRLEDEIR
ncbi:transglycosylase domain-containing protein [Curvivirga aplysinae]|uniref:transglycosylase domain-containing protein n=1 Tax=Curvivirga aplysinae TaxID=2529852 RepID=UPI0012BB9B7D|nr:PBP1A family penicillin-binding protein [Curvivirga aplysinae]MTI10907.1 PBP1A family penicillin-binding protein [Curvivirga aplysinae]